MMYCTILDVSWSRGSGAEVLFFLPLNERGTGFKPETVGRGNPTGPVWDPVAEGMEDVGRGSPDELAVTEASSFLPSSLSTQLQDSSVC